MTRDGFARCGPSLLYKVTYIMQGRLRQKLGVIASYFLKRLFWVAWQVTYRCNFRCSFCDYWTDKYPSDNELTPEQFARGGDKLFEIGNMMISLAGGEPLLRKDLPDIVEALAKYHMPMITTNGWLVTEELARELWQRGLYGASVSIDFDDPQKHDQARGVKGAYDRAVAALDIFSRTRTLPRQKLNLMAVLRRDNAAEMEKLILLAQKYNAYFMVQPYCSLKTGNKALTPEGNISAHLLALKKKYKNFLSNAEFLARFDKALNTGIAGCVAGRSFFNIDHKGDIAKCVEDMENPIGNILDMTSEGIVRGLAKAHRENTCSQCWYNCRGEVEVTYSPRGLVTALGKIIRA
jgi:MoaA/NifB/PqqE/SkfB family radical SAM enzyme